MGLSFIRYGPFPSGCIFLEIPFCVVKFGSKKYVPICNFVAGGKSGIYLGINVLSLQKIFC